MLKALLNIVFVLFLSIQTTEITIIDTQNPYLGAHQTDFLEAPTPPFQSGEIGHLNKINLDFSTFQLSIFIAVLFVFLNFLAFLIEITFQIHFHLNNRYLFLQNRVLLI